MDSEMLEHIKTTESAQIFEDELELLLKSLYLGSNEFNSVLKSRVRARISVYIKEIISKEDVDIEKFLKDLIKNIKEIPTVKLIVAFEPTQDAIDRFYAFIVGACQRYIFLDIGYSPDIIGGVVIIYKGKYRDFSFKTIFEKEFQLDRENILKLLEK